MLLDYINDLVGLMMGNSSNKQSTGLKNGTINNLPRSNYPAYDSEYLQLCSERFALSYKRQPLTTASCADFTRKRIIGTGSFGNVYLCKHISTGTISALKVMRKRDVVNANQTKNAARERNILQAVKCPFIVDLLYSFKDNANLYLVLQYVPGGELFSYVHRIGRMAEDQAKFYIAQMILFLEYLHSCDVIYRDIKPENILIDHRGYIKVTDFGFAKYMRGHSVTHTLCGTPEYLAPELIVKQRGHGKPADWWALGVLLYEMTNGSGPFAADSRLVIYDKITSGQVVYPRHFSSELQLILMHLLAVDPGLRLGSLDGARELKQEAFLRGVNWRGIYEQKVAPPWIPRLAGEEDAHYYGEYPPHEIEDSPQVQYEQEFHDF